MWRVGEGLGGRVEWSGVGLGRPWGSLKQAGPGQAQSWETHLAGPTGGGIVGTCTSSSRSGLAAQARAASQRRSVPEHRWPLPHTNAAHRPSHRRQKDQPTLPIDWRVNSRQISPSSPPSSTLRAELPTLEPIRAHASSCFLAKKKRGGNHLRRSTPGRVMFREQAAIFETPNPGDGGIELSDSSAATVTRWAVLAAAGASQ